MADGTQVRRVLLQIKTDDGNTEEKLDRISAKADELKEKHPELKVKIDTAAAAAKLGVLRQELKDVGKDIPAIEPEVKDDPAKAKIDELKLKIARLRLEGKGIEIKVDATEAEIKIAELEAELKGLQAVGQQSGSSFLSGFTPAAGGITAGVTAALAALPGVAGLAGTGMGVAMIGGMAAVVAKSAYSNVQPAVQAYQTALNTVGQAHTQAMKTFASYYDALSGSQQHLVDTANAAANAWQGFVQDNTAGMTKILSQGMGLLPKLFNGMSGILQSVMPQMSGIVKTLGGTLDGLFGIMKASAPAFGPLISSLLQMVNNVMPGLQSIIKATTPALGIFSQVLTGLGSTLGQTLSALAPGVRASAQVLLSLGQIVGALLPSIGTLASAVARALAPAFGSLASIIRTLAPVAGQLAGMLAQLAGAGLSIVLGAVAQLLPPLARLATTIMNGLQPLLPPLTKSIQALAGAVTGPLISAVVQIIPQVSNMTGQMIRLFNAVIIPNLPTITRLTTSIAQISTVGIQVLLPPLSAMMGALASLANNVITPLIPLLQQAAGWLAGMANAAASAVGALGALVGVKIGGVSLVTGLGGAGIAGFGATANPFGAGGGASYTASASYGAVGVPSLGGVAGGVNTGPVSYGSRTGTTRPAAANIPLILSQGIMAGLTGTASQVQGAISRLLGAVNTDVSGKYLTTEQGTAISRWLEADQGKLVGIANRRARILATIQQADAYAKQVTSSAESTFGVVAAAQSITPALGVGGIMRQLLGDVAQIRLFRSNIAKLRKMGLNKAYIDQLIQAGPVTGGQVAAELAAGNEGDIRGINKAESQIAQASVGLGQTAANLMFDSGKMAGKGFLSGLQAQQKELEAAMRRLADALVEEFRRKMRIHSPSEVTRELGRMIPAGLALGIEDGRTSVTAAAARMAHASAPGTAAGSGAGGRAGAIQLEWVGGNATDALITLLKNHVRVKGGNPAVLGA